MVLKHYILFLLVILKTGYCYSQTYNELFIDLTETSIRQALEHTRGNFRLKIKGVMDGDDIFWLRRYAVESLISLDLTESGIKEGGMSYYTTGLTKHYTQDSTIGAFMFSRFKNLEQVILPENIVKINKSAFDLCRKLNKINIPNNVEMIGEGAFAFTSLEEIVFPHSLKEIEMDAFYGTKIKSIYIPTSLIRLDKYAFQGCDSLVTITVDPNHDYYSSFNGTLYSKDYSIIYMHPANNKCQNIVLPESTKEIVSKAFSGCKNLYTIELSKNIEKIGIGAFGDCINLQSFTIPDLIKEIKSGTFSGCKNLKTLYVPEGFINFGSKSFYNCNNLEAIYCFDTQSAPGMSTDAFPYDLSIGNRHYNASITLYVPYGAYDVYAPGRGGIGNFFLKIKEMESTTSNDHVERKNIVKVKDTRGKLVIETSEKTLVTVYDIRGKLMIRRNLLGIESVNLANGIYIISTKYGNIKVAVK